MRMSRAGEGPLFFPTSLQKNGTPPVLLRATLYAQAPLASADSRVTCNGYAHTLAGAIGVFVQKTDSVPF